MFKVLVTYKGYSGSAMQVIEFPDIESARNAADKLSRKSDYEVTLLW